MAGLPPFICPFCSAPIDREGVKPYEGTASCVQCGTITPLPPELRKERFRPLLDLPVPPGVTVQEDADTLCIRRRWLILEDPSLLPRVLAFVVVLCFYGFTIASDMEGAPEISPFIGIPLGAILLYLLAAAFINRTEIRFGDGILSVRHLPLPWFGSHTLSARDVSQIFSKVVTSTGRSASAPTITYELWVALHGGDRCRLMKGMKNEAHAIFMEQKLEHVLGIEDRPTAGEILRF